MASPAPAPTNPFAYSYSYTPDNKGGVNYFQNGQPVTNTQYAQGTGANINDIQARVAAEFAAKNKTAAHDVNDNAADSPASLYGVGGSVGGSGRSAKEIASDLAYLDSQEARLRGQQGSADRALNNGLKQLGDSYNSEVSKANSQRSQAIEDFNTRREDTTRSKDSALNKVNSDARSLAESLRRRIGMASGSGSSAYQITAPGAVANEASGQRGEVQENFGVNFRNLATAEDRAKVGFDELLSDLEAQRRQRESDFRSGILDRKNQIDTSLSEIARQRALAKGGGYAQVQSAMAPYSGAIDARQAEIDGLFDRFRTPFSVKAVDVKAPELRDYTVGGTQISQTAAANDPYAEALRKKQLEEESNSIYG